MDEPNIGLPVTHPISIWNKPLSVDSKSLFKSLSKGVGHAVSGNWYEFGSDVVDLVGAGGAKTAAGERAWLLIYRSLHVALLNLVAEAFPQEPEVETPQLGAIADQLDATLQKTSLTIDQHFFERPASLEILPTVQGLFQEWLVGAGLIEAQAVSVTNRLPSYFVYALHQEWQKNAKDYDVLTTQIKTPFTQAAEREQAWNRYHALLQKRCDESVFDEPFGLAQIYVPLRAYSEKKSPDARRTGYDADPTLSKTKERHVIDLMDSLLAWVDKRDVRDAVRVITGGPGSGKSSFCKMLAARLATQEKRVLFIPMHQLDAKDDPFDAAAAFVKEQQILSTDPFHPDAGEEHLIVIFDGLDELAMQGKASEQVAHDFARKVNHRIENRNTNGVRLQILISGREVVVQASQTEFDRDSQILTLLPYYLKPSNSSRNSDTPHLWTSPEHGTYHDAAGLLDADQRDVWWNKYSVASGKSYDRLPKELKTNDLDEITAQPLLNYLVALSFDRKQIDFTKDVNINQIYADLLERVYERGYAHRRHRSVQDITFADFVRIVEVIGLAAWHGNGRTTTVQAIKEHCGKGGLTTLLAAFTEGAEAGVTRLLTAFYFRQSGQQDDGARTFEFTHKSFGEYLATRRVIRDLRTISGQMEQRKIDYDAGLNETEALVRWIGICGPTPITANMFKMVRNEVALQDVSVAAAWQASLVELMNYALKNGMPMHQIAGSQTFLQSVKQARNAEEMLLIALSACALRTEKVSDIKWPTKESAGEWLSRLVPYGYNKDLFAYKSLCYLNLAIVDLAYRTLIDADLTKANLSKVNLSKADLMYADLMYADLSNANLTGANLEGANLTVANLEGANLTVANLNYVRLWEADLMYADLSIADLSNADLSNADLSNADLSNADLSNANLTQANLTQANLTQANLRNADLTNADLEGAIFYAGTFTEAQLSVARNVPKPRVRPK